MHKTAIAFACAILFATAASAQDCSLEQIASLPLTTLPSGAIAVPVNVNGNRVLLAVAIQSPRTALDAVYVHRMGGGDSSGVTLRSLGIGKYTFNDVAVAQIADSEQGTAGVLGVDTLRGYDVEIDFKGEKLNLFTKQHCKGNVVYWTNSYTMVPFSVDASGQVVAQMTLDGKPVNVAISTAPGHLAMRSMSAQAAYKMLGIGGISLSNPQIAIAGDIDPGADIRIGLDDLKMLHLFFAFSENKLYVTP